MPSKQAPPSTIARGAVTKLLSMLPELGLEPAEVCAEGGFDLTSSEEVDARVPLPVLHALWEAVMARSDRADLALVVAQRYQPGDYGLVAFVAMASATVREALEQMGRHLRLWAQQPELSLRDDGVIEVSYRAPFADRPGLHRATEATLAEPLHALRQVTQRHVVAQEVRFSHPAPRGPGGREAFEAFFGSPVHFDQPSSQMRLPPEVLAMPLPRMDPELSRFLQGLASDALARSAAPEPLVDLRRVLAEQMQRGVPSLAQVAHGLALSERTLRRRLMEAGTTFRGLYDQTRAELARSYMDDRRLPLSEVAFLLGFSEPSAFNRAFKRWTGSTPGAWRQRRG
ncbi:MAG TPA: AraC family transcriptional regulator [Myxococcales bacterium]|nr:AraC family transcriptional regulator [Myxococcales bacterium]